MPHSPVTPTPTAGIRNFAWVIPGQLARGEQPSLTPATLDALRALGITTLLSLRAAQEAAQDPWPAYDIAVEQSAAAAHSLSCLHIPCTDYKAPAPEAVAQALREIDSVVATGGTVYVHCLAGVGRSGVISAAWAMTRGWTGDEAAAMYFTFLDDIARWGSVHPERRALYFRLIGQPYQWWALRAIAAALGTPVTATYPDYPDHKQPAGADDWEQRYTDLLQPWRARRPSTPAS